MPGGTQAGRSIEADSGTDVKYHGRWYTPLVVIHKATEGHPYRILEGRRNCDSRRRGILLHDEVQYPVRPARIRDCACRARRSLDYDDCSCGLTRREFRMWLERRDG